MAVLLVLMLAASGVPSPLYRVYQQEFGFSSGVLTTVFGIYAFALLARCSSSAASPTTSDDVRC